MNTIEDYAILQRQYLELLEAYRERGRALAEAVKRYGQLKATISQPIGQPEVSNV